MQMTTSKREAETAFQMQVPLHILPRLWDIRMSMSVWMTQRQMELLMVTAGRKSTDLFMIRFLPRQRVSAGIMG